MQSNHEIVVPNEDLPFKMFLFEGEKGNYFRDKHWHRSIEIFMVFEGHLKFYLNDLEQKLNPGEFVLVNSNEIHFLIILPGSSTFDLHMNQKSRMSRSWI